MQRPSAATIYHTRSRPSRLLQIVTATGPASPLVLCALGASLVEAAPSPPLSPPRRSPWLDRVARSISILDPRSENSAPADSAPSSPGVPEDPLYLPAQIGGIVGSYALCLVLVAIALLALSNKRRTRLQAADELEVDEDGNLKLPPFEHGDVYADQLPPDPSFPWPANEPQHPYPTAPPQTPRNFSYPALASPTRTESSLHAIAPSPTSTVVAPGVDLSVDQNVVAQDRKMAQAQLEDMYRLVMEQEAAKEAGVKFEAPPMPGARQAQPPANASTGTLTKKERAKPANLNLAKDDKPHSRTASILSALKSPLRKKQQAQGLNISSPIMTPMSGTFPRGPDAEEMRAIPPRHYAPAAPPPIPTESAQAQQRRAAPIMPLTPDTSPDSNHSIDAQLAGAASYRGQLPLQDQQHPNHPYEHSRNVSTVTSDMDPGSAASEKSSTPLVGLPSSPKPGATRFPSGSLPSLPSSPKPGATFQRANAPSAVRTGGALPLRAYEPAITSPGLIARTTKETTFERAGPMSPNGQRTPFTGAPVPYSPYQPFSPVIPMTPTLVTKADRKRMRKMEPKTPTLEMVKSDDEIW